MQNLNDVVKAVRELSYDRFPIPVLGLKKKTNTTFTLSGTGNRADTLTLNPGTPVNYAFTSYTTLESLFEALVGAGYVVAQLPYYRRDMVTSGSFYKKSSTSLNLQDQYLTCTAYYSDDDIKLLLLEYLKQILKKTIAIDDLSSEIDTIASIETGQSIFRHMTLCVALWMVSYRRLLEYAATAVPVIYSDGTGISAESEPPALFSFNSMENRGDSMSVQIGGVFNLNDVQPEGDNSAAQINGSALYGGVGMPGTELHFGDENGFWYRYFCYLRAKLENEFGDYNFRNESGVWGTSTLKRDLNFRAYFDSWPFTIAPSLRGI